MMSSLTGMVNRVYVMIAAATLILGFLVVQANAEVAEEAWVAIYNGPGDSFDYVYDLVVDGAGNVYVTGESEGLDGVPDREDYATVRYDPDGNELWVARYNGPGNGRDRPNSLAVDMDGNVYVTGDSAGDGTGEDYATIKYDADGNEVWVARYNGTGNSDDGGSSLTVDDSGHIYVTGSSTDDSTGGDCVTIKYDADGNEVWVARYNGPGNGLDAGSSLSVDDSGYIYVTGLSMGDGTGYDCATIKYDAEGNEVWVARYNGPGDVHDVFGSLAVDPDGNVYVTGRSTQEGTDYNYDYATIKYDADGNEVWAARYNGPANDSDVVGSLAVDPDGNVYVTGGSYGEGTGSDYATIKYDADGNELWVARYDGPLHDYDRAKSLALDSLGNVYVVGIYAKGQKCEWQSVPPFFHCYTVYDYATIKYDSTGKTVWVKGVKVGHTSKQFYGVHVEVDELGNVYTAGGAVYATNYDFITLKHIQVPGSPAWGAASTVAMKEESVSEASNCLFVLLVPIGALLLWKKRKRSE